MPKKGHTEEQILQALRQAEGGEEAAEICRKLGISDCWQTFPNPNKVRLARNSRTVVARKAAGQRRSINERLGLGVFESRRCRFVNRCLPESKTGERLVYEVM